MSIRESIWEIIEKYDNGDIDECIEEIKTYLGNNKSIKQYKVYYDDDVFDSCGLDIYYLSVSWIDNDDVLDVCGAKIEHY